MNAYQYYEKDLQGGWKIEVFYGRAHIGNIRRNPLSGAYQYYKGINNVLNCSLEDTDLDEIKKRIEESTT